MTQYTPVPCPHCHRTLRVRREYADKTLACQHCNQPFQPKLPIPCPNCRTPLNLRLSYLGQRVTCRSCDHTFRAPRLQDVSGDKESTPGPDPAQVARLEVVALEDQAERLRKELTVAHDALNAAARERQTLRDQLEQARTDLAQAASLREELDAARSSTHLLRDRMRELEERTREVEVLRTELEKQHKEAQRLAQSAQATASELRRDLDAVTSARDELSSRLREAHAEAERRDEALRQERESGLKVREDADRLITEMRRQLESYQSQCQELTEQLARTPVEEPVDHADEIHHLREHLAALETERQQWHKEREALGNQRATLQTQYEATLAERETLQNDLAGLRQNVSASQNILAGREDEARQRAELQRRVLLLQGELDIQRERTTQLVRELELANEELVAERERALAQLTEEQSRRHTERQALENQREAARRRAAQEQALTRREAERLRTEAETLRIECDRLSERLVEADATVARLAEDLVATQTQLEGSDLSKDQTAIQQRADLEAALAKVVDERDRLATEYEARARTQQAQVTKLLHEAETRVHALESELLREADRSKRLVGELGETRQRLHDAEERLAEVPPPGESPDLESLRHENHVLMTRLADEQAAFRGELTRLREETDALRRERDRLVNLFDQSAVRRAEEDACRKYETLTAQIREVQQGIDGLRGAAADPIPEKRGLGRLWGRPTPEREEPSAGATSMERRLDALRVEAAVERERSLRILAEGARADLEKQLAAVMGQLRGAHGQGNGKPQPDLDDVIPLPHQPPPPRTEGKIKGMPRSLDDLF